MVVVNVNIGVVKVGYYLCFLLIGSLGMESKILGDFFGFGIGIWLFGFGLLMLIFDFGCIMVCVD